MSNEERLKINGHILKISNPEKVFWKEENYTKLDVIKYYHEIASTILPYLKDRPMVLRRNPQGINDDGFFQKDTSTLKLPSWIKTIKIQHANKVVKYLMVQDEATLIYIVNLGCIELNPFNSRAVSLENPDYLIFDLDPEDISFDKVIETAQAIHKILEKIEVKSVCKTSGGRGLHVCVPLGGNYTYELMKKFAVIIAEKAHQKLPAFTSLERMPAKRQKKVYIDVLQNEHTKTHAAGYSLRPKSHATVSAPLRWSEVKCGLDPKDFNIITVPKRISKVGDLYKPILGHGIDLKKALSLLE